MDYRDEMGKSNIIIYTTEDGLSKIETTFDGDTVWLSIDQWQNYFREINQQFQGILKIFIQKKNLCRKQLLHICNSSK